MKKANKEFDFTRTAIMRILLLDSETTGLSYTNDHLIEVAGVIYCTKAKTILAGCHFILPTSQKNPAEFVNRISALTLQQRAVPGMAEAFKQMYSDAECIVAHNAKFDQTFITRQWPELPSKPWVCSLKDISYPKSKGTCRKLNHLAVDHGIIVTDSHRAMNDVIVLAKLLAQINDLEQQLNAAMDCPVLINDGVTNGQTVLYQVTNIQYDPVLNVKYKAAGFRWDTESKRWRKRMAKGSESALDFETEQVRPPKCFSAAGKMTQKVAPTPLQISARTAKPAAIDAEPKVEAHLDDVDSDDWDL
jgi:DNA polymerase III subunit epsilon